jgi:diguanylate cyclase
MGRFTILPQDDPKQAIRIRRLILACSYSVLYLIALYISFWQGLLSSATVIQASIVTVVTVMAFYAIFRLGLNKKFADASLTGAQLLSSIIIMLYVIYFAPETRVVFIVFLQISFMFGMLRLKTRDLLLLGSITLLGYLAVTVARYLGDDNLIVLRMDLLQWFVLAITLPSFILMGGRIRKLRTDLRETSFKLEGSEDLARRDELTGVYNRRYLTAVMNNEKTRCDITGNTFCLCIIDIDFFKNVNDTVGHLAGDEVLRTLALHFQKESRGADTFGRYGGEEFMQILSNTPLEGALIHAERMRHDAEKIRFPHLDSNFCISISIGVAQYEKNEPVLHTFARADEALYQAKAGGRNRVAWLKFGAEKKLRLAMDNNLGKGRQAS